MIFAVTNQKGGVGKTTTVINLGAFLAKNNLKVLLVDTDPQANLTSGLGLSFSREESKPKTMYDLLIKNEHPPEVVMKTRIENLSVLPSEIGLAGAEVEMVSSFSRENILKRSLEKIKDSFDVILIDCPPSLGLLTVNGLVAAEKVLIPVQAEYFALEGLGQLVNTITLIKNSLNATLEVGGVIITMYDSRTNLSRDVRKEIADFFEDKLFKTEIPRNIKLSEAPSHGLSIEEYDSSSKGANAYKKLTQEFIKRFALAKTS